MSQPQRYGRDIITVDAFGEDVQFIASNDRLHERATSLEHESYVLEEMLAVTDSSDTIWDVGACLGIHSLVPAVHNRSVVSFEPVPQNRGIFVDNMNVNNCSNITVKVEGLANRTGHTDFAIRESTQAGYGKHSFDIAGYKKLESVTVPITTGDQLIRDGLAQPDCLKIDVEGASPLVLAGLNQCLSSSESPSDIFLETHVSAETSATFRGSESDVRKTSVNSNEHQPSHEDFGVSKNELIERIESYGYEYTVLEKPYHLHFRKC